MTPRLLHFQGNLDLERYHRLHIPRTPPAYFSIHQTVG
jgi:hypothetical protein